VIRRKIRIPPEYVYPAKDWKLIEKRFYPRLLAQTETLFSLSNGYLGMRGNFEEGRPAFQKGTFVNGFHETWPIMYGEEAYGFARTGQTIVNVTDSKIIRLYVDDEPFYLPTANLLRFERVLDMKAGRLDREILWETPSGKRVSIKSRRLISFQHRHLAGISYQVTVLNASAPVVVSSEMVTEQSGQTPGGDPRRARGFAQRVLLPEANYSKDARIVLSYTTQNSKMTLACGIDHTVETTCPYSYESKCSDDAGQVVFSINAQEGKPFQLTKYMTYHTSRSAPAEELCERAERTLNRALGHGFEELLAGQQEYLDDFWRRSDVELLGAHPKGQQLIRWNLFQIIQAAGRAEGGGIPAKGLTGLGYEGHYFWDAEIYILPFLIYTAPRIAKNLLKFRHSMLDKARKRAREVNQKGALFPWRTINGEEASAYYAAGTAQYHINADIMYGLKKYVEVTGDEDFLHEEGAEMLVETARMWNDLGFYSKRKGGKFCIHGVTGPDEYNTVVNNNTFTNLMARENLRYAAATVESLRKEHPERFTALVDKTGVDMPEVEEWKKAAESMYIPFDWKARIHPQDDSFIDKEVWDFENTPPDKYPLLLYHHPLVIYRRAVIKQADIVLAMFLLGQEFSPQQKRRNFDYYDALTTGDSSLSVCIQSILASEIGYTDLALEYLRYAVLMDLADIAGNVEDGIHIASIGGTWMAAVYGLAGMRDYEGHLSFNPRPLPGKMKRIRFPVTIRSQVLAVDIDIESVTYSLKEGEGLVIRHGSEEIQLSPDAPISVRPFLKPSKPRSAKRKRRKR
jgi:alpha,alpha-trehalose phosphorylase